MKFWLYDMQGDKRYLDKTSFMTPLYNEGEQNDYFEGAILDDTSVIDPVFKFSREKYWKHCNYIFCQDTNRYYYVQDVTMSRGYVLVKCHVDVLMSFKDALKNKRIIAKRSETKYNLYLDDDKFKAYAPECDRMLKFKAPEGDGFDFHTREFIMCVVGNTLDEEEN